MTTTKAESVRKAGRPRAATPARVAASIFGEPGRDARASTWPRAEYRTDPARFFREVLGVEPTQKQIAIALALVPENARVAVKSGHKVGKTKIDICIALWFYCSFEEARVVLTSTTSRQVDRVLWRELRMTHHRARVGLKPDDEGLKRNPGLKTQDIGGEPATLARSGLVSPDFREITGFTAKEAEAVAGVSGRNLLYIVDEASGVPQAIIDAIEGNRAGGVRILLTSNPTKCEGEFFEAFGKKAKSETNPRGYTGFTISSEESPNVVEGRTVVPGLATPEWIEEKKADYGEDSDWYKVRVKGEFPINEAGKIISLALITGAEERWEDAEEDGVLHIGLDPAGPAGGGDESVFALRRGKKLLKLIAMREQSEDALLVHLLSILREYRRGKEVPIVLVDREGLVGAKVFGAIRGYLSSHPESARPFHLVGVRSSEKAKRDPQNFDRVRDELWENMRVWLRDGGAIPSDVKLEQELHAPKWVARVDLKRKAERKEDLRKFLGRSPDRADALCLAVWEASDSERGDGVFRTEQRDRFAEPAAQGIDPYAGESAWRSHGKQLCRAQESRARGVRGGARAVEEGTDRRSRRVRVVAPSSGASGGAARAGSQGVDGRIGATRCGAGGGRGGAEGASRGTEAVGLGPQAARVEDCGAWEGRRAA